MSSSGDLIAITTFHGSCCSLCRAATDRPYSTLIYRSNSCVFVKEHS